MKRWLIIGLGWLGQALATDLTRAGFFAAGTHRASFVFERDEFPPGDADVVVLNTPPLTAMPPGAFAAKVKLKPTARLLFISSTSVYGDHPGRVDETTPPSPTTPGARWLVAVESELRARFKNQLTIVRPGGLIGGERHPVGPLSRRASPSADGPVNLIHREDLIGILRAVAARPGCALINAVAPHHPLKSAYYARWAAKLNLPSPRFETGTKPSSRVVDSIYLKDIYDGWRVPNLDRP